MCNRIISLVLITLGLAATPAATFAQVVNLALNPSFEEDEVILDDPEWTMWATWGYESGLPSTVALDDSEFIDGTRSLKIMPTGDTNWYFIVLNLPIPLQVGTEYTASFWVKAEAPRPLGVQFKDTANKPVTWGYTDFQLTTEWAEYWMTAAAQDAEMKLEFFCSGSEVPFWLDFLYIYEGDHVEGIEPSAIANFGKAVRPTPASDATDVPGDVVVSWTAAKEAAGRNVYFGTDLAAVSDADPANPLGVLAHESQAETTYAPADLQYGQTYYWRVDEIGAPPDSTIFKGDVWRFTVEPYAYPIRNVAATASSAQAGMGAQNTINGSGLNAADQHSTELTQMWMSTGAQPNWIQYEFDAPYKLHELWVWNSNQLIEAFMGFGARHVIVEYSLDGAAWTALEGVPEFTRASGSPTYTANTVVDFGGVTAQYVKLTVTQTWGGMTPQTGLSEVRFSYVPVQARGPQPPVATTGVSIDTELDWRPGREATSHDVYLGTDENALASVATVTEHRYVPPSLDFGTTYFWKVDEVGDAGVYPGAVWSFTTQDYTTIDDFESYNDDDHRIYDTWIDGLTNQASGSQVGYDVSPFAERSVVHTGKQSLPLLYDNSASPFYSEAERTFASPQNWTIGRADSLLLHFRAATQAEGNSAERLYVTIRDSSGKSKTVMNPDTAATTRTDWQAWRIPLSEFTAAGVKMNAVKSMTIGVGNRTSPAQGGTGTLFLDDIGYGHPVP